jgi:hypothetical protein
MNPNFQNATVGLPSTSAKIREYLERIYQYRRYGLVFALAFFLYYLGAGPTAGTSASPQYVYLAYSFLHGKLHLIQTPAVLHDLILYKGYWYVPGAIAPALVMLPFVAIWGLKFGDIWFSIFIGSLNVVLIYDLIGELNPSQGFTHEIQPTTRNWLTILFAAGTAHWYISSLGSVWFNAQVLAITFMILFVRETIINRNTWLTGIWLSLAVLSRPTMLFSVVFFLTYTALKYREWPKIIRKSVPVILILLMTFGGMLLYNYLRFDNPLDFGYGYVQGSASLMAAFANYGGFNLHYFPCNFYISILGTPNILGHIAPGISSFCQYLLPFRQPYENAWVAITPIGMSIFFVTPAFVYIFKTRCSRPLVVSAWAGLISVIIPLFLYHNTGAVQFGYRYILDLIVFMILLMAAGMHEKINFLEKATIGASVLANFVGMVWMYSYYYDGNNLLAIWMSTFKALLKLGT